LFFKIQDKHQVALKIVLNSEEIYFLSSPHRSIQDAKHHSALLFLVWYKTTISNQTLVAQTEPVKNQEKVLPISEDDIIKLFCENDNDNNTSSPEIQMSSEEISPLSWIYRANFTTQNQSLMEIVNRVIRINELNDHQKKLFHRVFENDAIVAIPTELDKLFVILLLLQGIVHFEKYTIIQFFFQIAYFFVLKRDHYHSFLICSFFSINRTITRSSEFDKLQMGVHCNSECRSTSTTVFTSLLNLLSQ
jgi:hypothetical protein